LFCLVFYIKSLNTKKAFGILQASTIKSVERKIEVNSSFKSLLSCSALTENVPRLRIFDYGI